MFGKIRFVMGFSDKIHSYHSYWLEQWNLWLGVPENCLISSKMELIGFSMINNLLMILFKLLTDIEFGSKKGNIAVN